MRKITLFLSLIMTLILTLSSTACGGNKVVSFSAFSTNIRIEAHDKNLSSSTQDKLTELFTSLESEFDKTDKNSFLYKLNHTQSNLPQTLSPTALELLNLAKEYYAFTSGKFDPTIAPLVELWQFEEYPVLNFTPPTADRIAETLSKTDFSSIVVDGNAISKTNSNVKLDLGGLVKGYAVDKALEIMLKDGHSSGYINLGNSSMALLSVESLNVSHPRKQNQIILTINTKGKSNLTLSTSGDYQRYHEYDGKKYSHIIDPKTGYPIQTGIASATVIGGTGAFTDAITTALCICNGQNELTILMQKIIEKYPDCQIYIVYEKDGVKQIITNKKQGEDFTLLDAEYSVINI